MSNAPKQDEAAAPAKASTIVAINVTITVNVDLKDPTTTEARFLASVNEKLPEARQKLFAEFKRLKSGGTPTVSEVS